MEMSVEARQINEAARMLRGLSDPTRLTLLCRLMEVGEQRVTDLVVASGSSQANVSKHLACLRGCGLVAATPAGRETYYPAAAPDEVSEVLRAVDALLDATGGSAHCEDHDPDLHRAG